MPIPTNHAKLERISAKDTAYNQILEWIIDGTLLPGEKLKDEDLAKALGVSRTPVRESLQLLESQGFVEMYPGKATKVTEIEKKAIKDLLPPLAAIQALSGELAIPNVTTQIINDLTAANNRFLEAIEAGHTFAALRADEEFHQIIVTAANNIYIDQMLKTLQAHVRRHFYHNAIHLTKESIDDHARIIELLQQGDREELSKLMRHNWLHNLEKFSS